MTFELDVWLGHSCRPYWRIQRSGSKSAVMGGKESIGKTFSAMHARYQGLQRHRRL